MTERRSKYNARRIEVDGIKFDSRAEAERYQELKLLERAGQISDLRVHPRYEILPGYVGDDGKWVRKTEYIADFEYHENGLIACEDVKGVETPLFRLKLKIFRLLYKDIQFRIVRVR